ncbi:MAG TPA: hypothetical protein VF813_05690, partial [Anaerolineaceae bacterium]
QEFLEQVLPRQVGAAGDPAGDQQPFFPSRAVPAPEGLRDPARQVPEVRDRSYLISARELVLMSDVGKFRAVSITDLGTYRYEERVDRLHRDIRSLEARKFIRQHRIMVGGGREKFSVLELTKQGKKILAQYQPGQSRQVMYAGIFKLREVAHDAAVYRMYQVESVEIAKRGGRIARVVLGWELHKSVHSPLSKARPALSPPEYARHQQQVAVSHGLKFVEGKIPLPDLRIEYETAEGDLAKVDLELATEHYNGRYAAEKLRAGFKTYADRAHASRLNAAVAHRGGAIDDGPEITAGILSL